MVDYTKQTWSLTHWRKRLTQLSSATIALIVIGIVSRVVTVATQIAIAREFGATIYSDAYFATETIPELFIDLVANGFSMAFIPLIMYYRFSESERSAKEFISTFLIGTTLFSILFTIFVLLFAPQLVTLIAPGFTNEGRDITIQLVQVLSFSLLFLGLNAGLRGLLHASQELLIPDLGRLGYNIVLCLFAIFLSHRFGIIMLAWGIVLGTLLQMSLQLYTAVRRDLLHIPWTFNAQKAQSIIKNILPLLVVLSWAGVTFMLDRMVASQLSAGSITALTYASRIILIPVGIFVLPIRTAIFPNLSNLYAQGDLGTLANHILMGLRVLWLIVIPTCILLTVLRVPITRILFEHGAFDSAATLATSQALIFYALGVPAIAYIFYLNGVFMSLNSFYIIVVFNLISWGLNLALNLTLSQTMGFAGIALGTAVSATVMVIFMLIYLKGRCVPQIDMKGLLQLMLKISVAAIFMLFALALFAQPIVHLSRTPSFINQLIYIALLSFIGLLIYLISIYILQVEEVKKLRTRFYRSL